MPEGHQIQIRYPATAVETLQARGAVNDITREKGRPEFFGGGPQYEDHPDWGKRFVCSDCGEEFGSRDDAREHARETFPGYDSEE